MAEKCLDTCLGTAGVRALSRRNVSNHKVTSKILGQATGKRNREALQPGLLELSPQRLAVGSSAADSNSGGGALPSGGASVDHVSLTS